MALVPQRKVQIVVLDDDPTMIRLLCRMVERQLGPRVTVDAFTDPQVAWDWIQVNCCDILVSDLQMPKLHGLDVLRLVKQRDAWTQVIFVTGRSTVDKIDAAIEQGASDYLLKPLDKDELILVLEHAIARCERWQRVALKTDQVAAV